MLRVIAYYQRWISPLLPPRCRFVPSCSTYAYEAIQERGVVRGGFLAFRRICKCHPFHPGGYDPVPIAQDHCASGLNTDRDTDDHSTSHPHKLQNQ